MQTFQKNFVIKISGNFYKNPKLLYIWKVICGAIFLKLTCEEIVSAFRIFLINEKANIEPEIQDAFQNSVNYLNSFFLNENAPFNPIFMTFMTLLL